MRVAVFFVFLSLLISPFMTLLAHAESDFDDDGIDDLLSVNTASNPIVWMAVPSAAGAMALNVAYGAPTDILIPASWFTPGELSVGVVHPGRRARALLWSVVNRDGALEERTFGKPGDYVVSGGDFDGDGIADGALVRVRGTKRKFHWTVRFNLMADTAKRSRSVTFGSGDGRLLYLNPEGAGDWIGYTALSKNKRTMQIHLRDLTSKRKRVVRKLPASLYKGERPRPFPVKSDTGEDAIGFIFPNEARNKTMLQVYDIEGMKIFERKFPGAGTVFVGNVDIDTPGEEILFISGSTARSVNPFLDTVATESISVAGTALDSYQIKQVSLPATPTPVATATPTGTPTRD